MSRYTSTNARLRMNRIATAATQTADGIRTFAEQCAVLAAGHLDLVPTSAELRAAVAELPATGIDSEHLPAALVGLAKAYAPPILGQPTIALADLEDLVDALAFDEHSVLHDAFVGSLLELGFEIRERHTTDASMIWATADDTVMAVEIGTDGEIELDTAGRADDSCVPLQKMLIDRLAARGVVMDLERGDVTPHRDPRGGALFARWHGLQRSGSSTSRRDATRRRQAAR